MVSWQRKEAGPQGLHLLGLGRDEFNDRREQPCSTQCVVSLQGRDALRKRWFQALLLAA